MKEIKLYYVVSDVFGELLIQDAEDLDEATSYVQDEWANSGDKRIVERTYIFKEETEHIVDTDY